MKMHCTEWEWQRVITNQNKSMKIVKLLKNVKNTQDCA